MSEKLKPCRACKRTTVHQGEGPSRLRGFWVQCGCSLGPFRIDRDEAIRLWNTRKGESERAKREGR